MTNAALSGGVAVASSESLGGPRDVTPGASLFDEFTPLKKRVIELLAHGKLNAWDAYHKARVSCLRTHVSHLEKKGIFVCRERFDMPTQFGRTQSVVRYWIEPAEWERIRSSAQQPGGAE